MKFTAFERSKQGTGASRRLRISGKTPGIVYGGTEEPKLIELDHNALWHALKKEAFHASILDMELGGQSSKVLLRDVQYHPFKQLVLHVDFQRVNANQRITMKVPVHFKGEEESPAVKGAQNLVTHVHTELEISSLPADLPEFIAVDLSTLAAGSTVFAKDVALPQGVHLVSSGETPLASAVAPAAAEEDAPAAPAAGEAAAGGTEEAK